MNQQNVLWGSFIAAALVVGCSGSIDVGTGGGGAGPTGATAGASGGGGASANDGLATPWPAAACTRDTPLPTWPNASDCTPDSSLTIAGTWHGVVDGTVDSATTPPFNETTLVISGRDANGHVCGTYTVGTAAAPPPVSNPNVGYPASQSYGDVNAQPIDGAPLSLLKASLVGSRLSFYYAVAESRRGWCQTQRSYDAPMAGTCRCLPPWPSIQNNPTGCALIDPNGGNRTVSCGQVSLCLGLYCACNSTGCDATQDTTLVDVTFDGDNAAGSVAGGRVVFTRAN